VRAFREWSVRLWQTIRPRRDDADLERELRAHLELEADAHGRSARYTGVAQAMEAVRDQRGLPWLEDLARDIRYGIRTLALTPAFTLIAVASLAIGIGANCAVFSFADALLLRPLTVPEPDAIVTTGTLDMNGRSLQASYPEYLDIRERIGTFESLVAFASSTVAFTTGPRDLPTGRIGMLVSGNFFEAMRVSPALGRAFRADEDQVPGRDAVVVLGHEFWTRSFSADRSVIGRTVRLNGNPFAVIGVAPEGFSGLDRYTRFEFFAPLMMWPKLSPDAGMRLLQARDLRQLTVKGRLKPAATLEQTQAELALLSNDLARTYPDTTRNRVFQIRSEFQDRFRQNPSNVTLISMLAFLAAGVLFVACANVAGLLASRAPMRAREVALRLAIGAGRGRIVRQLITESLLIAGAGGLAGLAVGYAGVLLFRQFRIPTELPIAVSFRLDQRALAISLAVAAISAVLFGLAPAVRAARADLTSAMKANDSAGLGRRRRGRGFLVGGQVAIAVVLLAVATFMYRDFQQRLGTGPGFRRDHLLEMWFDPSLIGYGRAETEAFYQRLRDRIERVAGVKALTVSAFVPTDGGAKPVTIVPEGFVFPQGKDSDSVWSAAIDDRYLDLFDLPLITGRNIAITDRSDAPSVAVVNEQFANRYWPGQNVVGKRFRLRNATGPWVEVIGLVKTTKYSFLLESPIEFVYFSAAQRPQSMMALVVETDGEPAAAAPLIRAAVGEIDANQPIYNLRTVEDTYQMRVVSILNIIVRFVGAMGLMGLVLAIVGLYGLVSYAVSRRTKEIGIRMAIGADRDSILRMMLGHGGMLAVAGLAVGLIGSAGAARAMRGIFPAQDTAQGSASGPIAYVLVSLMVLIVTLLAAYLPARRAASINPTEALRHE
jgi:macrolide transport system ATP-binding/permease protein